jgi:integrase
LQDAWERVREEADLPGLRLHDLRHSFAIADGQTLFMVAKLLGHKQTRTTERYAHLAPDPILAAANKTADRIAAAMRERGNHNPVAPTSPQTRPEPNDTEAA